MLEPFFDRSGIKITPEQWLRLVAEPDYSAIATDTIRDRGFVIRTRWIGHDREDYLPPRIFLTGCMGDPDVTEVTTATELEALKVHAAMCAKYRHQSELIEEGGAPLLNDGVL